MISVKPTKHHVNMELCRRTVMAVGDIVNIWIYIANLGSAEQFLCSVASTVTALSAAHDTVPPQTIK